jgi:hypothetical protein
METCLVRFHSAQVEDKSGKKDVLGPFNFRYSSNKIDRFKSGTW